MNNGSRDKDLLIAYALDELPPREREGVERRAQASPEVASELARVQRMIAALRSGDLQPLAAPLHQRLRRLLTERARAERPSWIDAAAQAVLTLLADTRLRAAAAGYRGSDDAFLLSFSAADVDVDVRISPRARPGPGRWMLHGCAEISGEGRPVEAVLLARGDAPGALRTDSDENGLFVMEIADGSFELVLRAGERVFRTPAFDVP